MSTAVQVKDLPILMHARSINGILEGRKLQTRRIVKAPRGWEEKYPICAPSMMADPWSVWWHGPETDRVGVSQACPHGKPGGRLWVRERLMLDDKRNVWCYSADGKDIEVKPEHLSASIVWAHHKRSDWAPPMFMPRWASRFTLEVTNIRVERVHDISEEDCIAEGCPRGEMPKSAPRGQFRELWDETNGKGAWERNDWVWVISFRRVIA